MAPTAHLTRHEMWLICIAGAIWMLINGALVVMLSFGPTLVVEREPPSPPPRKPSVPCPGSSSLVAYGRLVVDALQGAECGHGHRADRVCDIGLAIPFMGGPSLTFALFGVAFAIATPAIASLPAEILRPDDRATGFGIYYIWYYAGSAVLPPVGGLLKDATGTATAAVLFSASMMFAACACWDCSGRSKQEGSAPQQTRPNPDVGARIVPPSRKPSGMLQHLPELSARLAITREPRQLR